jgi:hypothetical protein
MTVLKGVSSLDAKLVHHTGSMIRFVTSQLPLIPSSDLACTILLPDGQEAAGRWHPHQQNPYLAGPGLVRWIKSWVPYGKTTPVRVHQVGASNSVRVEFLHTTSVSTVVQPTTVQRELRRLAKEPRARRRVQYERWERNSSLRSLALSVWAPSCQVQGCTTNANLPSHLSDRLVDIHHLNHVGSGGSDSPLNLSVLCVSHHYLIHRAPISSLTVSDLSEAEVKVNGLSLHIDRDMVALMAVLK